MKKAVAILAAVAGAALGPTWASENKEISMAAMRCWAVNTVPAVDGFEATFDVEFDHHGNVVRVTEVAKHPASETSDQLARMASEAIKECGPYNVKSASVETLTLRAADME